MGGKSYCVPNWWAGARRWALALLLAGLAAGCASTPQASRERDLDAKQFGTHPATAALYVFRPDRLLDEESVLYIDDRLIGATSLGHTDHVGVVRGLIQGRVRLGEWKEKLAADPSKLMDAYLARAQASDAHHPQALRHAH